MRHQLPWALLVSVTLSCATGGGAIQEHSETGGLSDSGLRLTDSTRGADGIGRQEASADDASSTDIGVNDSTGRPDGCILGTANACARCDDVCPGIDDHSTTRLCRESQCTVRCEAAYYDVNGDAIDGCEFEDDSPEHGTAATARDLGTLSDCDLSKRFMGRMPSDDRHHASMPTDRPHGLADHFKIRLLDEAFCSLSPAIALDLEGFPKAARYELSFSYRCDGGKEVAAETHIVPGGGYKQDFFSTKCTTLGDDSGTLLISVKKLDGPHANTDYTLVIRP